MPQFREHGVEIINRIARHMVAPSHRDGGQSQYIEMPVLEPDTTDDWPRSCNWRCPPRPAPDRRRPRGPRIDARAPSSAASGDAPAPPRLVGEPATVVLAARLLERGNDTIASVSIHSGFGSPDTLRRHFVLTRGVTPDQYRRAFRLTEPDTSQFG